MLGSTDFKMQSLCWRVVPAMRLTKRLAMTTLKCRNDLTTASREERKEEGEVVASSQIKEARNLDPHTLRERQWLSKGSFLVPEVGFLRGRT